MTTQVQELGPDETLTSKVNECVILGVIETFSTILGGAPTVCEGMSDDQQNESIVGIISLVGETAISVLLGLPKVTAIAMSTKFAGFEIDFDSSDMGDVVGELANVVAGDVVARLDRDGWKTQMSLPTVVRGRSVELLFPETLATTQVQFTSGEGRFWIEVVRSKWGIHQNT